MESIKIKTNVKKQHFLNIKKKTRNTYVCYEKHHQMTTTEKHVHIFIVNTLDVLNQKNPRMIDLFFLHIQE